MLSFRSRVVIIVLGMVIGISSLLFTNDMARQLREKEQNEVAIWAAAFRELGADPGNPCCCRSSPRATTFRSF